MRFYDADHNDQVKMLNTLAREALAAWGIFEATLTLLVYANNAVFRVDAGAAAYVLRVQRPGHKARSWIASELAWLRALADVEAFRAPVPARDLYTGALPGVEEPVFVVLFNYIDGEAAPAADHTPAQVRQIGAAMAHLHTQAARFAPPPGFERPSLDWEGLFGERSPYNPGAGAQYITPSSEAVLGEVAEVVRGIMAEQGARQLIHGDFIFKNTLFTPDGGIGVIDFDDCGFGYPLYDMACPLLFYKPLPHYPDLKAALWDGYTSVRPLPASAHAHLETFVAGRYVASCRWVAGNAAHPSLRGKAGAIIDGRVEELRGFLRRGAL